jgi:hypothetical protein
MLTAGKLSELACLTLYMMYEKKVRVGCVGGWVRGQGEEAGAGQGRRQGKAGGTERPRLNAQQCPVLGGGGALKAVHGVRGKGEAPRGTGVTPHTEE